MCSFSCVGPRGAKWETGCELRPQTFETDLAWYQNRRTARRDRQPRCATALVCACCRLPNDQSNLDWLFDRLRSRTDALRVAETDRSQPMVRGDEATMDVTLRLSWTAPNGEGRLANARFRARTSRLGGAWVRATLRALQKLE